MIRIVTHAVLAAEPVLEAVETFNKPARVGSGGVVGDGSRAEPSAGEVAIQGGAPRAAQIPG